MIQNRIVKICFSPAFWCSFASTEKILEKCIRPVLIVQNDVGNRHSPTVIAAAITSQRDKNRLPTHIEVQADKCGLARDSIVLLEQIRTIDKRRLKDKMGELDTSAMSKVDDAISISFGLM